MTVNSVEATEGAAQAKKTSTKVAAAAARKTKKGTTNTRNPTPINTNAGSDLPQANATRDPTPVNANAGNDLPRADSVDGGALQAEIDRLNRKFPVMLSTSSNDLSSQGSSTICADRALQLGRLKRTQ